METFGIWGRRRVRCGTLRTLSIAEEECSRGVQPGEDNASAPTAAKGAAARSKELPAARCRASSSTGRCKLTMGGLEDQVGCDSLESHIIRGMLRPPESVVVDVVDLGLLGCICEV